MADDKKQLTGEEKEMFLEPYRQMYKRRISRWVFCSEDNTFLSAHAHKPPRTDRYWALCGDGQIRKVTYFKRHGQPSVWRDERGFVIPDTWGGIRGWKPLELGV